MLAYYFTAILYFLSPISAAFKVIPNYHKIIVIGAGPAGIAAASRLVENGETDILILEAEDRVGGRIHSVELGEGGYVDLGAEWCHGQEGNIVYDMMKSKNILRIDNDSVSLYYSDGQQFDKQLAADIVDFLLYYRTYSDTPNEDTKFLSEGERATQLYDKIILEKYKDDPSRLEKSRDALRTLEGMICSNDGCFTWNDKAYYDHYEVCEGPDMTWGGHGYYTIIRHLMEGKNILESISLNTEVQRINWKSYTGLVEIACEDNAHYFASHLIFTPSLGVLKADHEKLFRPSLPERKIEAIEKLGFGSVMKILINFPVKWWSGRFQTKSIVWSSEDKAFLSENFPEGPVKDGSSWLQYVNYFLTVTNHSNTISAWITGDIIPDLEIQLARNDTPIKDGLMFILHKFLDNEFPNISKMDQILFPQWYSNKHFRGTYSYETIESVKTDFNCNEELGATLYNDVNKPVVFFAGEATNQIHYGTVHGAIETGYRAADSLLAYLKSEDA